MQDQIIEEIKELVHTKTERSLKISGDGARLVDVPEGKEAKRLQGARKPRKDEVMGWGPTKK